MHMEVNGRVSNKLPVVIWGTASQGTSGFETRSRERKWRKRRSKEAEELREEDESTETQRNRERKHKGRSPGREKEEAERFDHWTTCIGLYPPVRAVGTKALRITGPTDAEKAGRHDRNGPTSLPASRSFLSAQNH